jgi:hypothetical protein
MIVVVAVELLTVTQLPFTMDDVMHFLAVSFVTVKCDMWQ